MYMETDKKVTLILFYWLKTSPNKMRHFALFPIVEYNCFRVFLDTVYLVKTFIYGKETDISLIRCLYLITKSI